MTSASPSPEAFIEGLKDLVATSAASNVELAARVNALVKEAVATASSTPAPSAGDLLAGLLDLHLSSQEIVNRHVHAMLNELLSIAEHTVRQAPPGEGQEETGDRDPTGGVHVRLEGRVGEQAACPFMVENRYDRPLDVSFEAAPLTAGTGHVLPASAVLAFTPPAVTVPAKSQAFATATISITDDFVAGEVYRTTIRVHGFDGQDIAVDLTVLPPPNAVTTATPAREIEGSASPGRARPGKQRRTKEDDAP